MDEGKRNILGDFIISTVIGCAGILAILFISFMIVVAFMIIITMFK
jgi:hypothetical protein